jgi:hypothetical protein
VGVSGPAAFTDRGAFTVERILSRADDCLYTSNNSGHDQVTVDVLPAARP